jgi:hypothetical protein
MRLPARTLPSALIIAVLCLLALSQAAFAKVESVQPSRVTQTTATFDLHSIGSVEVRSAAVRLGTRRTSVSIAKVKRAARTGLLRVRLPHHWRGAIVSRSRSASPKLIVKTRPGKGSGAAAPAPAPAPSAPASDPAPAPSTSSAPQPTADPASAPDPPAAPAPAPQASITGRAYYVSPSGSDTNAGTSPQAAWRTVARANRASLSPGDGILFQGGATFSDDALMPDASGAQGSPLVFGSYGTGKASFTKGAWFMSKSWLAFTDLSFTGSSQGVSGSINGSGSDHILVQDSSFADLGIAVNAANHSDSDWTLRNNHIDGIRDSGVILNGDGHVVDGNTILNTGTDSSIPYGKHGIYLKSSDSRVTGNTIRSFEANGVSTRYRNAVIEDNVISGGQIGIAWFQNDPDSGTSFWRNNTISETSTVSLYVSRSDDAGATRESFVVSGNRLTRAGSSYYTDFQPTSGAYTLLPNIQL